MIKPFKIFFNLSLLFLFPVMQGTCDEVQEQGGLYVQWLAWSEEQPIPLYVQTDVDTFERLDLRSNKRSPRYKLLQSGAAHIYTDGVSPEGLPIKIPVVKIPIAERMREPMVILFSVMNAGKPVYRGMVVEDSEQAFPFGSYQVVNFTEYPILFELDEKVHQIKSRTNVVARPKGEERKNIPVRFHVLIEDNLQLFKQTYWRHEPDQRMIIFVLKSKDTGQAEFRFHTVSERESVYRRRRENTDEKETP